MSEVQHIRDADVDATLDREIRDLLCTCFGQDTAFKDRRYGSEMPAHRWLLRSDEGALVGHVAGLDKSVTFYKEAIIIIGIAEACVHPDYRRWGMLRKMLTAAHFCAAADHYEYSVLFGYYHIYTSSGYVPALNLWNAEGSEKYSEVMVRQLGPRTWPHSMSVQLQGPRF